MFRILLACVLICTSAVHSLAQDTLRISELPESAMLCDISNVNFYKTVKHQSLDDVKLLTPAQLTCNTKTHLDSAYWFTFVIMNDLPSKQNWYIYTAFEDGRFYIQSSQSSLQFYRLGVSEEISALQLPEAYYYNKITLDSGEVAHIHLEIFSKYRHEPSLNIKLENERFFYEKIYTVNHGRLTYGLFVTFYLGALSFTCLFMLVLFSKNKQLIYLYYALFLLGNFVYGLGKLPVQTWIGYWVSYYPYVRTMLSEPVQFLSFSAYYVFVISLLDLDKRNHRLYRVVKTLIWVYLCYAVVQAVLVFFNLSYVGSMLIFAISRLLILPINIFVLYLIYRRTKSSVVNYFVIGASIFIVASILASYFTYNYQLFSKMSFGFGPVNIYQVGILGEVLCFSFALGYRMKISEDERINNQQAYIEQLQENKRIVDEVNIALEAKVRERSEQVISITQEIERERTERMRLDWEKRLGETEMMALRSQMNPHFLFNSLNSIKYFILSNQNAKASRYLSRFSKLIRQILDHSRQNFITLQAELDALILYLEIESNRFDDKFKFFLDVSDDVPTNQVLVPPMVLQPFVENAIWHGLLHATKEHKHLFITVRLDELTNEYVFAIEDNGIGRRQSAVLKQDSIKSHTSVGIGLIENRIELINKYSGKGIRIDIEDLYDSMADPLGTRVVIRLKNDQII